MSVQQSQAPVEPQIASGAKQPVKNDDNQNKNKRAEGRFSKKWKSLVREKRSFRWRLALAALASFAFSYTLLIFGPYEIYIKNMDYCTFSFNDLVGPMALLGFTVFALLTLFLLVFRGRLFTGAVSLIFAGTVAAYLQANFLSIDFGALDGSSVAWADYTLPMLFNALIWGLVLLCPFAVAYFSKKIWGRMVVFVSVLLIGMQSVGLVSLLLDVNLTDVSKEGYLSRDTIYEVSPKNNVVVFLLDRFDQLYADEQLEKNPDFYDKFSGFTFYRNTTGSYSRTFPSVAYFLTGIPCDYTIPNSEYFKKAWDETTFLKDIREAGYLSKVYTEVNYVLGDIDYAREEIDNIGDKPRTVNVRRMITSMLTLSAYRYCPTAMQPFFRLYTGELQDIAQLEDESLYASDIYSTNDVRFFHDLKEKGITVNKDSAGSFIFYHMQGSHDPYIMDENGNRITGAETTMYQQTKGNLNIILKYIDELKRLGLYDDTTLIITADHGWTGTLERLDKPRLISLFVKPKGADLTKPLALSDAPVCQDNIRPTILRALGIDSSAYGPAIEDITEGDDVVRYFYMSGANKFLTNRDTNLVTYEIRGDAKNFDNWLVHSVVPIKYPYYDAGS